MVTGQKIGTRFAAGGIQQINIDIKFLLVVFNTCISSSGKETLKKLVTNTVSAYAKETKAKTRKNILNVNILCTLLTNLRMMIG